MYWGFKKQLQTIFTDTLTFDFIDLTDISKVENFIKSNTVMIWVETPSNPLLKVTDIRGTVKIAKKINALVIVDNTFMSPLLQNPIELGADIVVHSATNNRY